MKAPKGRTIVNVSEKKAKQLNTVFGYSYLDTPENPSEATTEPVTPTPTPKRRGRPRKDTING